MRRIVSVLMTCLAVLATHAQDIKIKKGEVSIGGNLVALIKADRSQGELSTPDGKQVLTVSATSLTRQGTRTPEKWLRFTSPDGTVFELSDPQDRLVLSTTKFYVYKLTDSKPQLINQSGIRTTLIDKLFRQGSCPFSTKWDSIYNVLKAEEKTEEKLIASHKFAINDEGDIVINKAVAGKIYVNKTDNGAATYYVKDAKGNQIAQLKLASWARSDNFSSISTFDDAPLMLLEYKTSLKLSEDELARRMVAKLLANGYGLGDMGETIKTRLANKAKAQEGQAVEQEQQLTREAMAASANIYNAPGKITLPDGSVIEGGITILYESIEKKMGKGISGILDLDAPALGSAATLTRTDASGNKTETKYKAADGVTVTIKGKDYLGVKGSKDGVLNNAGGSKSINIGTRHAQFFEVLYHDGKGNYVLQHPLDEGELYLKLKDRKEAVYLGNKALLGTRSEKTRIKLTAEYLNCTGMDASRYDTCTLEGLRQLISDYNNTCGR
ncbi:MAG: hypothetical protein K6A82_00900 [Prevotella sp.]|nr:hypothetical protein [Prevotella sp.]